MRLPAALTPLLLAASTGAQAWTLQSPSPTEQELHTVSFLTTDGGAS